MENLEQKLKLGQTIYIIDQDLFMYDGEIKSATLRYDNNSNRYIEYETDYGEITNEDINKTVFESEDLREIHISNKIELSMED